MSLNIRLVPYSTGLQPAYEWAAGETNQRHGILVGLTGPEGSQGWGEIAPPPNDPGTAEELHATVRRALDALGPDAETDPIGALDRSAAWKRIRAGMATAWLDAQAQANGRSLAQELSKASGSDREPRASVNANGLVATRSVRLTADQAARLVAAGFATIKVKSVREPSQDAARLAAIRDAVGPQVRLRLDVNGAWAASSALEHLQMLHRYDLEYVEQPVASLKPQDAAYLRRRSPIRLAWDESLHDVNAIRLWVAAHALDVAVLKPQRLGGPDRVVEAMKVADEGGIPTVVTNSLETSVGVATALHCASLAADAKIAHGLATGHLLGEDPTEPRMVATDGCMPLPPGLGLGVHPKTRKQEA